MIGRLSDSGFYRRRDKKRVENSDWKGIRDAQEAFANSMERAVWIDTDDLNGEKNELHLIKPGGYETLGKRWPMPPLSWSTGNEFSSELSFVLLCESFSQSWYAG